LKEENNMYDSATNILSFPHIIPGTTLGGVEHTFNSVNGGMVNIADLGLVRNKFFGGNVERLGLIKEYGFFACKHYLYNQIIGFYISDPDKVTELGKKLIQEKYPTATIKYTKVEVPAHRVVPKEELELKEKLIEEAVMNGAQIGEVTHNTVEELDGLVRAQKSGKGKNSVSVEEAKSTFDDIPILVEKIGK